MPKNPYIPVPLVDVEELINRALAIIERELRHIDELSRTKGHVISEVTGDLGPLLRLAISIAKMRGVDGDFDPTSMSDEELVEYVETVRKKKAK